MRIVLVDGTYELFRSHFGAPSAKDPGGREVGAVRGLLRSLLALIQQEGATHVACAFDHVIESFRNDLYAGYKTSEGVPPELLAQFPLAEEACRALGIACWPMTELEADDALATAAARLAEDPRVERVEIASPDKDLAQCVRGDRVVQLDRRRGVVLDEAAVREKYGVGPASIADWLALVGDTADGYPGVPKWGAVSASTVLSRWEKLEKIPADPAAWDVKVRGAATLAANLAAHAEDARLFRRLATLRLDAPIDARLEAIEWKGAEEAALRRLCEELGERSLPDRVRRFAS